MRHVRNFIQQITLLAVTFCSSIVFAQGQTGSVDPMDLKEVATAQIDTAKNVINLFIEFAMEYGLQVLGGIIVLVLGWVVAKYIGRFVGKFFEKKNMDVTVSKFMVSTTKLLIMAFAVIVAMGKFGIEIAPFIAAISVAGFGLSFALQGPLSNYAAGAVLIFTKPFKVGQIIEVAGVMGEVVDMKLARTEIKTVDGTMMMIPNKHIIGEVIHNCSTSKRLDIKVGVSYSADIDKAISIVKEVIKDDNRVVKEPNVGVSEFADSSVNIYARVWCKQDNYWNVMFDVNKKIFDEFGKHGIEIPFPQRDVHLIKEG